jgi:hypothetical protein
MSENPTLCSHHKESSDQLVPTPSYFTRLQLWYGKRRQKQTSLYKGAPAVDGFAGDKSYCERLLQVYNEMRSAPKAEPPRASTLLSHVPEWAQSLQITDDISDEAFCLTTLRQIPRLQAALANCTSYSPSKWLLEKELAARYSNDTMQKLESTPPRDAEDLIERYKKLGGGAKSWTPVELDSSGKPAQTKDVYDAAAHEQLAGLGLSGGGIRSATFCLGVLQTLAAHKLLGKFDYISSVSGGGYIHQWLAAWIHREPRGIFSAEQKLVPLPSQDSLARSPEQINWLRRYSSYLTPQRGLLTADTWTMWAIWFRNTFLNQIILFSFLAVCLEIVRALMHPFTMRIIPDNHGNLTVATLVNDVWQWVFALLTVFCLVWAGYGVRVFCRALASQTGETRAGAQAPKGAIGNFDVVMLIVLPGFLLSVIVALVSFGAFRVHDLAVQTLSGVHGWWGRYFGGLHVLLFVWAAYVLALLIAETVGGKAFESSRNNQPWGWIRLRGVGFGLSIAFCTLLPVSAVSYGTVNGYRGVTIQQASANLARSLDHLFADSAKAVADSKDMNTTPAANLGLSAVVAGATTIKTLPNLAPANASKTAAYPCKPVQPQALIALFLPVFFFGAQFMAIRLHLGLLGRSYEESRREWLARYGAWAAIVSFLWLGLGAIAIVGPNIYCSLFDSGHLREFLSVGVVALIHAVTLYSGSSSKTSGTPDPSKLLGYSMLDLVGIVGAPIAILSLLIIASGLIEIATGSSFWHVYNWAAAHPSLLPCWNFGASSDSWFHWFRVFFRYQLAICGPIVLFFLYVAMLLLFGWRVDVNDFSLHPFYRDRLARCYIGASNGCRVPDPFTGFDDHTEAAGNTGIALSDLLPARFGGSAVKNTPPYDGPMPIFCSTVNLTFGKDLAFQDRKGASFAFSPLYSGYYVTSTSETEGSFTTTYNGFARTSDYAYRAQAGNGPGIPLATVAAISGAALSPNQGFSSQPALAFLMTLFNVRLGWWIANPRKPWIWPNDLNQPTPNFGLRYLLSELFGYSDDTSNYVSLCDGGRFDNMGLYELVRRRCRLIVICDGEQDDNTTFEGIGLAIAKARIDFGVEIDFPPSQIQALTPNKDTGRSLAHFACGNIQYPAPPHGACRRRDYAGKIVYLKTAFVGDEPLDLLHYKREHPEFPQESTLNQWFTEPQFESYRRLGQLTAEQAIKTIAPQHD